MGQVSVVCLLYIAGSPRSDADSLPGRIVLVLLGLFGCWGLIVPTASMLTLLVLVALVVSSPGEDVSAATVCDLVVSCDEDDDERFRVLYRVFRT